MVAVGAVALDAIAFTLSALPAAAARFTGRWLGLWRANERAAAVAGRFVGLALGGFVVVFALAWCFGVCRCVGGLGANVVFAVRGRLAGVAREPCRVRCIGWCPAGCGRVVVEFRVRVNSVPINRAFTLAVAGCCPSCTGRGLVLAGCSVPPAAVEVWGACGRTSRAGGLGSGADALRSIKRPSPIGRTTSKTQDANAVICIWRAMDQASRILGCTANTCAGDSARTKNILL